MHEDTCIELFAFAVNSISSKEQPNKYNFEISYVDAMPYPLFFGLTSTCTETGTLTKALESASSDRQTNKSYGFI